MKLSPFLIPLWISTAEVISLLRAKPVFVDILLDTFNLDPDKLEAAITSNTGAILPVGIYGQCADMTRINKIEVKHGIPSGAYYTAPLHLQGAFAGLGHKPGDFPVAESVAANCLSLPMSPYLTSIELEQVAAGIKGDN